jgi:hypothetical protein
MHLADQIEHVVLHGTKPELEAIQQATGLKYEERGLLWDRPVRATLRLPHAAYTDWMHMLVASGGFAQYELNQKESSACFSFRKPSHACIHFTVHTSFHFTFERNDCGPRCVAHW